jgi:ADP-heptose:LPS heptosyltransferase
VPALRALRDAGARVTLAAQPRLASLLLALGEIDAACDFESLRLDTLFAGEHGARLPAVDRIVCWFGAREPDFARRLAATGPRVTLAPSFAPERDVWEHLLATLGDGSTRARRDVVRLADGLIAEGRAALSAVCEDDARPVVVVHPGAGSSAKCWPAAAFAEVLVPLTARRNLQVVVHEGLADAEPVAQLSRLVPSARVLRGPALPALAGVLAQCAAYVGNDSGVSHLAAAVGAPVVVLFTRANLAWRPWALAPRVLTVATDCATRHDVRAVRHALEAVVA